MYGDAFVGDKFDQGVEVGFLVEKLLVPTAIRRGSTKRKQAHVFDFHSVPTVSVRMTGRQVNPPDYPYEITGKSRCDLNFGPWWTVCSATTNRASMFWFPAVL